MARIHLETWIKAPPQTVFDLARDVTLHQAAAHRTRERAIGGVTNGLVELGDTVTWRAQHFGIWHNLTVRITAMERPSMFTDEMVQGAFASMRHIHRFEEADAGTRMIDEFEFVAPFGILGRIVERVVLERYMRQFLVHRNTFLKDYAEGAGPIQCVGIA